MHSTLSCQAWYCLVFFLSHYGRQEWLSSLFIITLIEQRRCFLQAAYYLSPTHSGFTILSHLHKRTLLHSYIVYANVSPTLLLSYIFNINVMHSHIFHIKVYITYQLSFIWLWSLIAMVRINTNTNASLLFSWFSLFLSSFFPLHFPRHP